MCYNLTILEEVPHSTTVCKSPWFLCGWQGIWWHLDVHTGMPTIPLIVAYVFLICHPFSMPSLMVGCDWIFQFTPCTPHHNHPNHFHLTTRTHLLCLESITHHNFQFWLKGFECLFPSMVQALFFYLTNSSKFSPPWNFLP